MSVSVICPQCKHEMDSDQMYMAGLYNVTDDNRDISCPSCDKDLTVQCYMVPNFKVLEDE